MVNVIYDKAYGGHHAEHVVRLFNYLNKQDTSLYSFYFIVHPNTVQDLNLAILNDNIRILTITTDEYLLINNEKRAYKKGEIEWEIIMKKCQRTIDTLLLLDMDEYQYLIGTNSFIQSNVKVSGILFSPYYRICSNKYSNYLKLKLTRFRKWVQIKWMLRNTNIQDIFIFNDKDCVRYFNSKFKKNCFTLLPDPVSESISIKKQDGFYEKFHLITNRKVVLAFGSINERKNINNIIKSFKYQEEDFQLLICGKCSSEQLEQSILNNIDKIRRIRPNINIVFLNRHLSNQEIDEAFSISDIIAVPYVNFFFSSGVIGHAAKYKKPVISSNEGLMGAITNEYQIGCNVNPYIPKDISDAISKLAKENVPIQNFDRYCLDNSTELFCHIIFSKIFI
jgi:glycosyltransferase involved in cell wall biosynthesis